MTDFKWGHVFSRHPKSMSSPQKGLSWIGLTVATDIRKLLTYPKFCHFRLCPSFTITNFSNFQIQEQQLAGFFVRKIFWNLQSDWKHLSSKQAPVTFLFRFLKEQQNRKLSKRMNVRKMDNSWLRIFLLISSCEVPVFLSVTGTVDHKNISNFLAFYILHFSLEVLRLAKKLVVEHILLTSHLSNSFPLEKPYSQVLKYRSPSFSK